MVEFTDRLFLCHFDFATRIGAGFFRLGVGPALTLAGILALAAIFRGLALGCAFTRISAHAMDSRRIGSKRSG